MKGWIVVDASMCAEDDDLLVRAMEARKLP
jgi:hypothetical protein